MRMAITHHLKAQLRMQENNKTTHHSTLHHNARTWPVFVHVLLVLIVRKQLITPFPLKQQSPLLPKMEYFPYSNSD